jgi:sarcosine oxidase subunit beta
VGAVFTCDAPDLAPLRAVMKMHARLGIRETLLGPEELREMEPAISVERIAAGCYEPDGGYADPALAAKSFSEAAAREGAAVMRRTRVTGLRLDGGRVAGVITDKGEISTRAVVMAAGPWTPEVAGSAGVRIPIYATRHPVVILQRPVTWRGKTPVWVDLAEGWYYKPEQQVGLMVGSIHNMGEEERVDIETHATTPSYEEIEAYSEAALRRFPVLEEGMAQGGWAGLYDMTPDSQPVIDRVPGVAGLFCAAGFSGHGFKLGPAVGVAVAEMVMEGASRTYDMSPFRFERFEEGKLTRGAYEYGIIG